jgi:hypothetical protein
VQAREQERDQRRHGPGALGGQFGDEQRWVNGRRDRDRAAEVELRCVAARHQTGEQRSVRAAREPDDEPPPADVRVRFPCGADDVDDVVGDGLAVEVGVGAEFVLVRDGDGIARGEPPVRVHAFGPEQARAEPGGVADDRPATRRRRADRQEHRPARRATRTVISRATEDDPGRVGGVRGPLPVGHGVSL